VACKTALVRQVPTPIVPAQQRRPATRSQRVSHRALFLAREDMAVIAAATVTDRDQLLVRALAETGAHVGEVLKLTPARLGQGYGRPAYRKATPVRREGRVPEPAAEAPARADALSHRARPRPRRSFLAVTRQHAHTIVTAAAAAAGVYRLKPERRDGVLIEVRTPAWPHLFRHGAATAMLEDSDDAVFVRDQLGHCNIRETLHYAALSDAKRRQKAAQLRIAPETWK
jgi:integrase